METGNVLDFYVAVCAENQTETNPLIFEELKKTTATTDVTVKLAGNQRPRGVHRLQDKDLLVLSRCLRSSSCVTGVDVSYNDITDAGVQHLADLVQDGGRLTSLDLKFNNIRTDGARVLAKSLQSNSSLLALSLSGNKMADGGAMHLVNALLANTTLKELQLAACDLADRSLMAFAVVLKTNRTLQRVDFSRPLLFSQQEEWAGLFSEMLAVNGGLLELHLGAAMLSDGGMERLAEGLRLNRRLRFLDLRSNRVSRDGARHLARALTLNPSLEVIDLSSNRIGDEGAAYLSEALTWPGCVLRELSVCRNQIGARGLGSLVRALKVNRSLSHVFVWGNRLEEPVCQAFRELLSSGRLSPEQTDVGAYEVDGRVFLSEASGGLRRRYHES